MQGGNHGWAHRGVLGAMHTTHFVCAMSLHWLTPAL
jgi:hypothetical protein